MKRKGLKDRIIEGQHIEKAGNNTRYSNYCIYRNMRKRVSNILSHKHSYFITFTIKDDSLGLQRDTYRRKIKEALGTASEWVANEDYGKINGRLHFHAFVGYDYDLDYTTITDIYKFGAVNFRKTYDINDEAISKYLLKLTLHALKETANFIFYSRKKRTT